MSALASRAPTIARHGRLRPADHFIRAATAAALHAVRPGHGSPLKIARSIWGDDHITPLVIERAATTPTTTATATALAASSTADLVASLAPQSVAAALFARGLTVPLSGLSTVTLPRRNGVANSLSAAWTPEGSPHPVVMFDLAAAQLGPMKKLTLSCALTRETAEIGGEEVIRTLLRESLAVTLDSSLLDDAAATSARPAGLRHGLTPIGASALTDRFDAMLADVVSLIEALADNGGGSAPVLITNPGRAAVLSLLAAGQVGPFSVLASPAIPADTILAVEPAALASAFGPEPRFQSSTEAVVHFEDSAPLAISTPGSPPTVASPVRSAFQSDLVLVKVTLDVAWTMRAPLVAVIEDMTW